MWFLPTIFYYFLRMGTSDVICHGSHHIWAWKRRRKSQYLVESPTMGLRGDDEGINSHICAPIDHRRTEPRTNRRTNNLQTIRANSV